MGPRQSFGENCLTAAEKEALEGRVLAQKAQVEGKRIGEFKGHQMAYFRQEAAQEVMSRLISILTRRW